MDDYTKILPKMLSGDELVKALSVVPKYDGNVGIDGKYAGFFRR